MFKGKLNEKYPMFTDKVICSLLKSVLWTEVKKLLIADARKKDMSVLEYIKFLKAYYEINTSRH